MSKTKIIGSISVGVVIFALIFNKFSNDSDGPIVEIDSGKVQGSVYTSRNGRTYFGFLGIPYALPPKAELRFQAPKSPKPWKNIFKANKFGSPCVQFHMVERRILGTESCLSINVFTPNATILNHNPFGLKLPVLVFVHGGYYEFGSSNLFNPKFLMDEDMVFVSLNYRLGALGFLSTGDDVIAGNFGLKDQAFAFKWIQNNIERFGGDKSKVTIMGHSAGGASVNLHMFSPSSKGLFRRVISGSGAALAPWTIYNNPKVQAQEFAKKLNCPVSSSKEIRDCLMKKSAGEIAGINKEIMDPARKPMVVFVPVIEGNGVPDAFINEELETIINSNKLHKVPWMSGVVRDEGKYFSLELVKNSTHKELMSKKWDKWSPDVFYFKGKSRKKFADRIKKHYLTENQNNELDLLDATNFQSYSDLLSDTGFFHPLEKTASKISELVPTYVYYFNYTTDISLATILARNYGVLQFYIESAIGYIENLFYRYILNTYPPYHSTIHTDELLLVFPLIPWPLIPIQSINLDFEMSKDFIKLITDFVGKEDLDELEFRGVKWNTYKKNGSNNYLLISNRAAMIRPDFLNRIQVWDEVSLY